jgi:ketosteroid isomerase-like protein
MSDSPLTIARALHAALEAGQHGAALKPLFCDDAFTLEHPNLLKPHGARAPLARMLEASEAGAGLLAEQHFTVNAASEHGDLAVLRLTWTGVIARTLGPYRAGQRLTAHVAQFITCRDGKVASIETYDCYEPLA